MRSLHVMARLSYVGANFSPPVLHSEKNREDSRLRKASPWQVLRPAFLLAIPENAVSKNKAATDL